MQAVNVNADGLDRLAERLAAARKRVLDGMTKADWAIRKLIQLTITAVGVEKSDPEVQCTNNA